LIFYSAVTIIAHGKNIMKAKNRHRRDTDRYAPRTVGKDRDIFSIRDWAVTLAVGIVALGLVAEQLLAGTKPEHEITLSDLNQRAYALQKIADPVQRDSYCIPLSAYGRALDRALDKNARVFFSGVLGETNHGSLGYYYFIQNYLFPRDVEISLDGHAVSTGDYFDGVPCDSPSVLQAKGFDLMIRSGTNGLELVPLTKKGVPHE
jgi:hypothetical protein